MSTKVMTRQNEKNRNKIRTMAQIGQQNPMNCYVTDVLHVQMSAHMEQFPMRINR